MSFQVTVLKVLAGHPGGYLSVDELKRAVAILICSGPDWTDRMKRLLARAPDLDIFSQKLVFRDDGGWQITQAGLALLTAIESPDTSVTIEEEVSKPLPQVYSTSAPLPLVAVVRRRRKRRRGVGARRPAA